MSNSIYKKGEIESLIKLAQQGDIKALEAIIRRVQKNIYAMFFHLTQKKEDVSDLTQDVLLKMAKNISKLQEPEKFKSWLNKIVTNTYYDYARAQKDKYVIVDKKKLEEIKDKLGCEPGEKCLFGEIEKLIKLAILTLPQTLRLSLLLREFEGLSYEDIAKVTNASLGTVKSRISRARLHLREELKEFI